MAAVAGRVVASEASKLASLCFNDTVAVELAYSASDRESLTHPAPLGTFHSSL